MTIKSIKTDIVSQFKDKLEETNGNGREKRRWLEAYYNKFKSLSDELGGRTRQEIAQIFNKHGWQNHANKLLTEKYFNNQRMKSFIKLREIKNEDISSPFLK